MVTVQDNVNNYYFKNKADFEAHKAEIPNNSTIFIEEIGELNFEINGTETENVENLTNIVVGDKTYKVPYDIVPQENILINGDFKFNQRLMNSYYGPNVYGPDRWQIMDEAAGCASTNDNSWNVSIEEVTTAGSRYIIAQNIENYKALSDTDVTAHIEYKDLTEDVAGTTYLCIYDGATETSQVLSSSNTSATVTAHIKSNPNQIEVYLKTGSTSLNMSMKVYYMKLEQGKNYTGKYYSNYETELARCQRFYQPVQVLGLTNIPNTTTTILVSANLITSLRAKPTASILFGSRMPSVTGNGATIACNGVTVNKFHTTSAILEFNLKTEATLLQLYTITTDCNIALDSEIYFTLGNN